MVFTTLEGKPTVLIHAPNRPARKERMKMIPFEEKDDLPVKK